MILTDKTTFNDAVKQLDQNGHGFLALIDENRKLLGILTDGDIRRAILNKKTDLLEIINKNPQVVKSDIPTQKVITILKELHRKHMPVIDDNGIFLKVVTLDDFEFNHKQNSVIIMAGGLGTRLGELTKDTPKSMLHIGEKPILLHTIEAFKGYGFTKFYISINYKYEKIMDFFKDGSRLGVEIEYIREGKRLGTGGALSLLEAAPHAPFFVINGDILTSLNFEKLLTFHVENMAMATMCIQEIEMQVPYGVIDYDNQNNFKAAKEKPIHKFMINTGMYVFDPMVLKYIPKNEFYDLPDLFERIKADEFVTKVYFVDDYWLDVGQPKDFKKANLDYTL
jgi:dTDP-glucose pyrophosphorylase